MSLSRRTLLRHAASASMFAAIASQVRLAKPARAETGKLTGPLNVLAWAGYDDPELIKGFKELTGVDVNVKEAQSDGDQFNLLQAGGVQFDVVNPDAVWTAKFAQAGLTMPLDRGQLTSMDDFFPMFKDRKETSFDGKLYGVPTRFGVNGFVHWTDKVSVADAQDAAIAWDSKLKNRVEIIDWPELYLWMAGRWLGIDKPENAVGEELDRITKRMIAFKPNMRALQSDMGTVKTDLINKDAWMVWGSSSDNVATVARLNGKDVALTIPKQGGAMWMETLQIVQGTPHLDTAIAYLNYMTSAKALKIMAWGQDKFAVTNAKVMDLLTADQVKALGLDKIDEWASNCEMSAAPVDDKAWADAWLKFKSA